MTATVHPVRFSADPASMTRFLAALGLYELEPGADGAVGFAGSAGRLEVRPAQPPAEANGRTVLGLLTSEPAAEISTPSGLHARLEQPDLSRPDFQEQRVAASMSVVAICTVPDVEAEAEFLARWGFRAIEKAEGYLPLTADPGAGVIGLRAAEPPAGPSVELGFETSEPFDALADRMRAAGHPAETVTDGTGVWVRITDPDGATVEVRPTR